MDLAALAKTVTDAYFGAYEIDKLTDRAPLSIPQAYDVQAAGMKILYARGDRPVGYKMGLTSKAKMRQMGVDQPIFGVLTARMRLQAGAKIPLEGRIHPKIEPEIAFLIGEGGECSGVCAAMEIIDSRFRNFNFTLPDVIADNCSSSGFVLGETVRKPSEVDLGNLGMLLDIDGTPSQFGSSAAIYGHPNDSLAELKRMLASRGLSLRAGDIVLTGAATAAVTLEGGKTFTTRVQDLGSVSVSIAG